MSVPRPGTGEHMRPIPATIEALEELGPYADETSLSAHLEDVARQVQALVPDVVGLSVASFADGVTFTMVATDEEIAVLDAVQYLNSGPCVEVRDPEAGLETTQADLFDEDAWRLFARASAALAVRSTLTLPIVHGNRVVGTVNLYGASDHAFSDRHAELARILGAWAPGAVANADLSFVTRRLAERAPDVLRAEATIQNAIGIISASLGVGPREAEQRLRRAAERAGISRRRLAEALVAMQGR